MLSAFSNGRHALKSSALLAALGSGSHSGAEAAVSPAVEAIQRTLAKKMPGLLLEIAKASGDAAGKNLVRMLLTKGMRASAKAAVALDYRLDVTNERATQWAKESSSKLVTEITDTTRSQLREVISSAFEEEREHKDVVSDIEDIIGDANRADLIARTETIAASNEGAQLLWDQAVEDGYLTGLEKQVWIVTPDDKLCPICEALEDQEAQLGEPFETGDGDEIDAPPAHPNCRCTVGLQL